MLDVQEAERYSIQSQASADIAVLEIRQHLIASGIPEMQATKISVAASELATNIIKYASLGSLVCERVTDDFRPGIRIIAQDQGPGINNVEEALQESFSTGGSLGMGLPGIKRMSDEVSIKSSRKGTTVTLVFWL